MVEREDFLTDLETRLTAHSAEPIVTRDVSKLGILDFFPQIFIVQHPDNVTSNEDGRRIRNKRKALIAIVCLVQGTDGETAPTELATFEDEMKRLVYQDGKRRLGNYGAGIREVAMSAIEYPAIGNYAVARATIFRVDYIEDVTQLFE